MKEKYTQEQIQEITNNYYVLRCSSKHITYTNACKIESVNLWKVWFSAKEIFKKLWFPSYIINSDIPGKILCKWNYLVKIRWENAFWNLSKRWRKSWYKSKKNLDITSLNDKEKIKYLETEVAYLRELHKEKYWFYP